MALDLTLLAEAGRTGRAFLRLYRFDPPCLSFGRHEPALRRYDREDVARLGIDVVRRPTGGRAVWHEHEVTYAVAAPVGALGSLRQGYRAIHARLAAALRPLGVEAVLAPDRPTARSCDGPAACFAASAGGELLVGDRKLVGSAQLRQGAALLQHGSILLGGSQDLVATVSRGPQAASRATTLAAVLGRAVSFEEVAAAILAAWGGDATPAPEPPRRLTAAFRNPAWTWRR